jgi:protein-disulfide isomerase
MVKEKIEKGDIVIITKDGRYSNQMGEVIEIDYNIFLEKIVRVKLEQQEENFAEKDLQIKAKKPTLAEAIASIDKILEQIEKISNFPTATEKVELPNRLKYLKLYLPKLDKHVIQKNFDGIDKILAAIKEADPSASFWQEIHPNLNKISWWIRSSL